MTKRILKPTTAKMPRETERQYIAFLQLYCRVSSLRKVLDVWDKVGELSGEVGVDLARRLGEKPNITTIENWSKKYRWVDRKELKLVEDLKGMREKTKKIARQKLHKIAETFEKIADKIKKQLTGEGAEVTMYDLKQAWEMLQVELGKPTSRTALKEEEQKPLTPEEEAEAEEVDQIIKDHYDPKSSKKKSSILDSKKPNKGRKRTTN